MRVAPLTQDTWCSNDYVSAVRLINTFWFDFYGVGGGVVYKYILGGRHKRAQPRLLSHFHYHISPLST